MATVQTPPFWHGSVLHGAIFVTVVAVDAVVVLVVVVVVVVEWVEVDGAGEGADVGSFVGSNQGVSVVGFDDAGDSEGGCVGDTEGMAVGY